MARRGRHELALVIEARAANDKPLRLQPDQIVDADLPGNKP